MVEVSAMATRWFQPTAAPITIAAIQPIPISHFEDLMLPGYRHQPFAVVMDPTRQKILGFQDYQDPSPGRQLYLVSALSDLPRLLEQLSAQRTATTTWPSESAAAVLGPALRLIAVGWITFHPHLGPLAGIHAPLDPTLPGLQYRLLPLDAVTQAAPALPTDTLSGLVYGDLQDVAHASYDVSAASHAVVHHVYNALPPSQQTLHRMSPPGHEVRFSLWAHEFQDATGPFGLAGFSVHKPQQSGRWGRF